MKLSSDGMKSSSDGMKISSDGMKKLLWLLKVNGNVVEPHRGQHLVEVNLSIGLCRLDVGFRQSGRQHALISSFVHGFPVSARPGAAFEERLGACLVDEIVVEKSDGRECHDDAVAFGLNPPGVSLLQVDAQLHGAVVDAHQMVVAEDAPSDGVDHLFVGDGKELPFADGFDGLYLLWCDVDGGVVCQLYLCFLQLEIQIGHHGDKGYQHSRCHDEFEAEGLE